MIELIKHELTFTKPISIEDSYILYTDDKIIAEMTIKDLSAIITLGYEKWTFQKKGWLTTFVHIEKEDLKVNLYKIPIRNYYQTKFRYKKGFEVKFRLNKFCNISWAWFNDNKEIIAGYKISGNTYDRGINIINEKYLNLDNLCLLIMLGWYLLITIQTDAYSFTLK